MSPTPKRQPMVTCTDCGRANDPGRGSTRCWYCNAELPSSELQPFTFPATGGAVRVVTIDGDPWFVAADVCAVLGIGNHRQATKYLDEDEKGVITNDTPGGPQPTSVVNEPGLYSLILRSRKPEAKAFKRWITHEVLPAIRKTGSYVIDQARELTRRDLAQMVIAEADRADQAEARADVAEGTVREIEGVDGLTLRMFHKKYFSDVGERDFFEHLYAKGYLIDQRRKGSARGDGTIRDGSQHRHPSFKGKPFLYLHFGGVHGDRRREYTRVRPGRPELDFKAALVREGLMPNDNDDGALFAIEGGA